MNSELVPPVAGTHAHEMSMTLAAVLGELDDRVGLPLSQAARGRSEGQMTSSEKSAFKGKTHIGAFTRSERTSATRPVPACRRTILDCAQTIGAASVPAAAATPVFSSVRRLRPFLLV